MMQWSNLAKCGLFFNIVSPVVHTLLPLVLQHLDSCGIEALILILKTVINSIYDLIIGRILLSSHIFFSCWRTENSQMVPNQENMEGDQPVQSHSHAQQPLQQQTCVQEHCPGETGPPSCPFISFPGRLQNVSSTTFQSPELLIQCGFIWKETMQLVRKGWI